MDFVGEKAMPQVCYIYLWLKHTGLFCGGGGHAMEDDGVEHQGICMHVQRLCEHRAHPLVDVCSVFQ